MKKELKLNQIQALTSLSVIDRSEIAKFKGGGPSDIGDTGGGSNTGNASTGMKGCPPPLELGGN